MLGKDVTICQHSSGRRIDQVEAGPEVRLGVIAATPDVPVAGQADEPSYTLAAGRLPRTAGMVVVDGQLAGLARSDPADRAPAALRLIQPPVVAGLEVVGRAYHPVVVGLFTPCLDLAMMRRAPRARVRRRTLGLNSLRGAVLAPPHLHAAVLAARIFSAYFDVIHRLTPVSSIRGTADAEIGTPRKSNRIAASISSHIS